MYSHIILFTSCSLLVIGNGADLPATDKIDIAVSVVPKDDNVLITCGNKQYYLGVFFATNYFKAAEFCRFHRMHLATIDNEEENVCLERHLKKDGPSKASYWLGASDQGHEGTFVWQATGRPLTYTYWRGSNPDNWCRHTNVCEHCLGLWYNDEAGRQWNDFICDDDLYFVCEQRE